VKLSKFTQSAGVLYAAATLLTGCGGGQPVTSDSGLPQTAAAARNPGHNWMRDGAPQWDLLYVSNASVVNVYRYWQYTLVGVLTKFSKPMGECVDRAGDVYIADAGKQVVFEYRHGGKNAIGVIDDYPFTPFACAVDLNSGDLAVANAGGGSRGSGNLAIYRHARGKPAYFTDRVLYRFEDVAYDDSGDLLTSNGCYYLSSCYAASFAYLPHNGAALVTIKMPGPSSSGDYEDVQSINYDGKYWVVNAFGLYRFSIKNDQAQLVGEIGLSPPPRGPVWFYRKTPKAAATEVVGSSEQNVVDFWNYPAGGQPIADITKGLNQPFGVAITLRE